MAITCSDISGAYAPALLDTISRSGTAVKSTASTPADSSWTNPSRLASSSAPGGISLASVQESTASARASAARRPASSSSWVLTISAWPARTSELMRA